MHGITLIACLLMAQVDGPVGSTAKPAITDAEVKRLVRELDADTAAKRDAAEKALVALGIGVLDHFPQITPRTPAEVKERLRRVRKVLETAEAESSGKASVVTLHGKMPLAKALSVFEEQTGNRAVGYDEREIEVQCDFDKVPYWEALDKLLDQAEMTVNAYGGESKALTLESRAEEILPRFGHAAYSGPFRFEAVRMESHRDFRNPAVDGLQLTLEVSWEPRIAPIAITQDVDQLEIKDDAERVVAVDDEQSLSADVEADITSIELTIPMKLPDRESRKIASAKGTISALLPGRVEAFEFDNLEGASDVEKQKAGVTVTLEQVRKNQALFEVRIRVRFDDAGEALQSHYGWVYNNEAFMIGPDKQPIESAGFQTTGSDENEVGVAYFYDLEKGLKGHTFVYKTPSSVLQVPVTYEIKDLELP